MRGVTKRFPRVLANDRVSFSARAGEVHALVGENGAGKSTLMKILYGLEEPDEGELLAFGEPLRPGDTREAIRRGLGMVHQHFMLVPPFTVAENVVLGDEPGSREGKRPFLFDRRKASEVVSRLSRELGLAVDAFARVQDLSVGQQQRVEILKVLYRGARVLILDEPTAVLTPLEVDELVRVLRALRDQGRTVIFITHKLREVMALSDRVTVLRRGAVAGTVETAKTSPSELAELMVGRPVLLDVEKKPARPGAVVLSVEGLSASSSRELPALTNVSFELRAGEILGIAGVEGNGQTELVEVLAGLRPATAGRVSLDGKDVTRASPRERIAARLAGDSSTPFAHVAEDRHRHGAILDMTLWENAILGFQEDAVLRPTPLQDRGAAKRFALALVSSLDVRAGGADVPFRSLSGGNQQKLVVARELARRPRCLVVSQLTRGVDIGATQAIWKKIVEERDRGAAVLLVSAELSEVLALSDRIGVLYGGQLVLVVESRQTSERELGLLMGGASA
ncbi:ABC transporter ATP-binding protein [bacterium]|nr:ABC transporter ATP-binding protein [bacterium]